MNASLALAAQTLHRVAQARQAYVLGTDAPLSIIDHVLVGAVQDAQDAYLQAGGTQADMADLLQAADLDATALVD